MLMISGFWALKQKDNYAFYEWKTTVKKLFRFFFGRFVLSSVVRWRSVDIVEQKNEDETDYRVKLIQI